MKAIALLSSGLDSSLAIKIILNQGIDVVAINFITPFWIYNGKDKAALIAKQLNIELKTFDISYEFLEMVKKPRYGYGKNLNPCIDCRILMLKKAKEFMNKIGARFIITGEVLGQRPMSQNKKAMEIIERESDLRGLIVRPLSAKLLEKTIPEKQGFIKRDNLFDIVGRSRKIQLKLAKEFNIIDYASPASGCLLTDIHFSLVMKDLLKSNMFNLDNINLVKNGRYFRIDDSLILVVGRDQEENQRLINLSKEKDLIIESEGKGPVGILRGEIKNEDKIKEALSIVSRYCKDKGKINLYKK